MNYFYLGDSNSDERSYARLAANTLGFPLIERELDSNLRLEGLLNLPRRAYPYDFVSALSCSTLEPVVAAEYAAQAVFRAVGGDELFFQHGLRFSCVDYAHDHGFTAATLRIAIENAHARKTSVWRELSTAAHSWLRQDGLEPTLSRFKPRTLLLPAVAREVWSKRLFLHPWLRDVADLAPGKCWHIFTLSHTNELAGPFARLSDPEQVVPLFSQPLIELCLRIPSYILTSNGWDRFLARRAFTGRVPDGILWRRGKCFVDKVIRHTVEQNIEFVRGLLLDGHLVRCGLVDKQKLEASLSTSVRENASHSAEVTALLSTEVWINTSRRTALRTAA